MPFTGFVCEADGSPVASDDCLACARGGARPGCHMTAPVINGILRHLRPDGFGLTVTTLLGCPRKWRLSQTHDYQLKPSEAWWSYRGQLMHGISAQYAEDDPFAIAEMRYEMTITIDGQPVTISGQPDLILLDRATLVDYKTTKRIPGPWRAWACPDTGEVIRESQFVWRSRWMDCVSCGGRHVAGEIETIGEPRPYPHHVQQVSLYRLLLAENGIDVATAEIAYMDMATQLRAPVELMSLDEARAMLVARLPLFLQDDPPGVLTDPDDLWACDFCPVRSACEDLHGGPVGKVMNE
ncbi:MAG TPA: hypothetical protein VJ793_23410 [Anaerolineae bacterium]|nr:hypothetical protein [Anaerolineae bacterium]